MENFEMKSGVKSVLLLKSCVLFGNSVRQHKASKINEEHSPPSHRHLQLWVKNIY